jgi:hypothetical protein
MASYHWHRYTAAESFDRLLQGENPWVTLGDFLDDWRRSAIADRPTLVVQPIANASTNEEKQWSALFAASVEQLCSEDQLPPPSWTQASQHYLSEPWYPGVRTENLRRLQAETTPTIFKQHNVFGGDNLLSRV